MKNINVVVHLAFEDLGSFSTVLHHKGYSLSYFHAGIDELKQAFSSTDPLFILGGPISVNDIYDYPFLADEISLTKERVLAGRPTFGICLGAQIIASALGAKVYAGHCKEIGWGTLELTPESDTSPLRFLKDVAVLHWHGDTFDLPHGATHLAKSDCYNNQAFHIKDRIIAVQFHPEVDYEQLEKWYIGHISELRQASIDITKLREDALQHGEKLKAMAALMLTDWLDKL